MPEVPAALTMHMALTLAMQRGMDRLDAQLLLLHALGRPLHDRAWLLAHDCDPLGAQAQHVFQTAVEQRVAGVPVAYLTGEKEFHGLTLKVSPAVLIPRPDTETLVDWALEVIAPNPAAAVVDLGTGSGAIALALKHQRGDLQVSAVDFSEAALQVARTNGERLGLEVRWHKGSWLGGLPLNNFQLIVSNPPYIAAADEHLPALKHEPLSALASGHDGLDDIRQIIEQSPAHLLPGGWLLIEHGYDQAEAVRQLLTQQGFASVQSRRDLAGIERCSGGCHMAHPIG